MALKGGIRQQLGLAGPKRKRACDEAESAEFEALAAESPGEKPRIHQGDPPPSEFLERLWRKGQISSLDVAKGSVSCKSIDPHCASWAKAGRTQNSHAQRDLLRMLEAERGHRAPPLYVARAPFWNKRRNQQEISNMYFLIPFEVLDHLVEVGHEHEWTSLGTDQQELQDQDNKLTMDGTCTAVER